MKKVFKTLILLLFAMVFIISCDEETPEEKHIRLFDKNFDGVVSDWEEPFSSTNSNLGSNYTIEIHTPQDLINASGNNRNNENVLYGIMNDLDFSSIKLTKPIDLGGASIDGNNKIVSNLNMLNTVSLDNKNCSFITNAKLVNNLKFHLGYSKFSGEKCETISIFHNCETIENVVARGRIEITYASTDKDNLKLLSFLASGENVKNITNCEILGDIIYTGKSGQNNLDNNLLVGGILATPNNNDTNGINFSSTDTEIKLLNNTINLDLVLNCEKNVSVGGVINSTNGEVANCNYNGSMNITLNQNVVAKIGGVSGTLFVNGLIRNCTVNNHLVVKSIINEATNKYLMYGKVSAGGLCGESFGNITYNVTLGKIDVNNTGLASVGGICGSERNSIIFKNITNVNLNASDNVTTYIAGVVGSAINGIIESVISNSPITVNGKTALDSNTGESKINIGLIYFQSDYFINNNPEYDTNNIIASFVQPEYSPSVYKVLCLGTNTINYLEYLPENISIGGVWLWSMIDDNKSVVTTTPYLFDKLFIMGSNLRINSGNPETKWYENSGVLQLSEPRFNYNSFISSSSPVGFNSSDILPINTTLSESGEFTISLIRFREKITSYNYYGSVFDDSISSSKELESMLYYLISSNSTMNHFVFDVIEDDIIKNYVNDLTIKINGFYNQFELYYNYTNNKYRLYSKMTDLDSISEANFTKVSETNSTKYEMENNERDFSVYGLIGQALNKKFDIKFLEWNEELAFIGGEERIVKRVSATNFDDDIVYPEIEFETDETLIEKVVDITISAECELYIFERTDGEGDIEESEIRLYNLELLNGVVPTTSNINERIYKPDYNMFAENSIMSQLDLVQKLILYKSVADSITGISYARIAIIDKENVGENNGIQIDIFGIEFNKLRTIFIDTTYKTDSILGQFSNKYSVFVKEI